MGISDSLDKLQKKFANIENLVKQIQQCHPEDKIIAELLEEILQSKVVYHTISDEIQELSLFRGMITTLRKENERLTVALKATQNTKQSPPTLNQSTSNSEYKIQIDKIKYEYQQQIDKINREHQQQIDKISHEYQTQLGNFDTEQKQLRAEIQRLENEKITCQQTAKDVQAKHDHAEHQIQLEKLRTQQTQLETEIQRLSHENIVLQQQIEQKTILESHHDNQSLNKMPSDISSTTVLPMFPDEQFPEWFDDSEDDNKDQAITHIENHTLTTDPTASDESHSNTTVSDELHSNITHPSLMPPVANLSNITLLKTGVLVPSSYIFTKPEPDVIPTAQNIEITVESSPSLLPMNPQVAAGASNAPISSPTPLPTIQVAAGANTAPVSSPTPLPTIQVAAGANTAPVSSPVSSPTPLPTIQVAAGATNTAPVSSPSSLPMNPQVAAGANAAPVSSPTPLPTHTTATISPVTTQITGDTTFPIANINSIQTQNAIHETWVSASEAMKLLQIEPGQLEQLVNAGELKTTQDGNSKTQYSFQDICRIRTRSMESETITIQKSKLTKVTRKFKRAPNK